MDSLEPAVAYDTLTVTPCSPHIGAEIGQYRPDPAADPAPDRRTAPGLYAPSGAVLPRPAHRLRRPYPAGGIFRRSDSTSAARRRAGRPTTRGCASSMPTKTRRASPATSGTPTSPARRCRRWRASSTSTRFRPTAARHHLRQHVPGLRRVVGPDEDLSDGLTALHDGRDVFGEGTPSAVHPVVARHPESGRPLLFVNGAFTKRIVELPEQESDAVLRFLCRHCTRPEWSFPVPLAAPFDRHVGQPLRPAFRRLRLFAQRPVGLSRPDRRRGAAGRGITPNRPLRLSLRRVSRSHAPKRHDDARAENPSRPDEPAGGFGPR